MNNSDKKIINFFSLKRIIIPVLIGLGATLYLMMGNFNDSTLKNIQWTYLTFFWLSMALVLMAVRDIAYMYRLRVLSDKELSWKQCFQVIFLWEFASSITPSIVGGSAIAMFIINREGINFGKSSSIVMITAIMDELFYVLMVPIIFIIVGTKNLFINIGQNSVFSLELNSFGIFLTGYIFILLLIIVLFYGVFINPHGIKRLITNIFKLPLIRKWKEKASKTGDEIITTSSEMKNKKISFWFRAFGATLVSWTARFWVVNCLMLAFMSIDNHLLIYARQLVMWVIMLVSPTPGSTGVAEFIFNDFLQDLMTPSYGPLLAIIWRVISYYPYIFIGIIILPIWLRRIAVNQKKTD